jgi:uncharacterized protein YbbC (DUF1343 family)/CubicO group peptidase (beta-lactamase class C family)
MKRSLIAFCLLAACPALARAGLPDAPPESVGFDPARLARIDDVVNRALDDKAVPGAVVEVGRRGKIAYAKAFGRRAILPADEPMTRDTVFDMASLTKPVATATSVMVLVEQGRLRLDDRLGKLLPDFDNHGKGPITVDQLLRHRAGFIADNALSDFSEGPALAWERIAALDLKYAPGTSYIYSDVGFMVLGRLVQTLSGQSLDRFAHDHVFAPLGMTDTGFLPSDPSRVAPTESDGGKMLRGVVHDPRSRALGGVAGHAGLFGTADDLAVFAQTLLNGGLGPNGHRILGPLTVRAMADPGATPAGQRRGLGWDVETPHSAPRGSLFGPGGFGHTGFTGTSLWVDPETSTFVVILTSRLHPDGKTPSPIALRSQVATVVASSIVDVAGRPEAARTASEPRSHEVTTGQRVACGIDVLARDGFAPLKGKRVGLVTNHTGLTRDGVSTIDALFKAPDVKLVALFSPEHGIRGAVDAEVADSRDAATGLPVFSLYGKTRKPSPESLAGVDALVYDIQDVGARFYTYISTLGLLLETARDRGIPLFVLDRPNPIGGLAVAGPVRDPGYESFIAHHALPVRHGMTVGELARLFNAERQIGADLHVIPCEGWRRGDLYDRTGLLWVNPSPNMRSLTEALLYPGIGLLEASNLATGRGTDTPFERVGAPWIDPLRFAEALNALGLPGVRFVPVRFTPRERQYAGQECGGVYLAITERDRLEPVAIGVGMACVLRATYPKEWKPDGFLRMLADEAAYQAVLDGRTVREVEAVWQPELADFRQVRAKYLIYP